MQKTRTDEMLHVSSLSKVATQVQEQTKYEYVYLPK